MHSCHPKVLIMYDLSTDKLNKRKCLIIHLNRYSGCSVSDAFRVKLKHHIASFVCFVRRSIVLRVSLETWNIFPFGLTRQQTAWLARNPKSNTFLCISSLHLVGKEYFEVYFQSRSTLLQIWFVNVYSEVLQQQFQTGAI